MGNKKSVIRQHYQNASKTGVLKLSQQHLKHFPSNIQDLLEQLRTLDLSENEIEQIPIWIERFKILKTLNLSSNVIGAVPLEIGCVTTLDLIDLSTNRLTTIPYSFKNLQNLKKLNLARNQIREFPTILNELPNLNELNLSSNELRKLPIQVGLLHVVELNLSNNQLESIPVELSQCKKLKFLFLEYNRLPLTEIHPQFFSQSQIIKFELNGNLFDCKNVRAIEGYDCFMQRCTAVRRKF